MNYLIEKQGLCGFAYHPMNTFKQWEIISKEMDVHLAKIKAIEYSEKGSGTYRVRDFNNGKVLFSITTT